MPALPNRTLTFVLPDDNEQPSGGNIYNAELIKGLKKLGQQVDIIDFEEYCCAPRNNAIYGVDSLFVSDLYQQPITVQPPKSHSFFIFHHLESLHPPEGKDADTMFERVERPVLGRFALILATSHYSARYLQQKKIDIPVVVVEPAVSKPYTRSSPISSDLPLRGLMVANVVERKGILPFLFALEAQLRDDDNFVMTVVGRDDLEPGYFDRCKQHIKQTALADKVFLTGAMSHEATLAQYQKHHLLVSASHMETFGMAIQEGRSLGMPLLVLNGGHSSSHVNAYNGKLCSNTFELARDFLKLSRNNSSLQKLISTAQGDEASKAIYHWEQAAESFLTAIHQLF